MPLPNFSEKDLRDHFTDIEEVASPISGGQKLVFPCRIGDKWFMLKILGSGSSTNTSETENPRADEVFNRALREVRILASCDCPNLPKVGPITLSRFEHAGQSLIAFSEQLIPGRNLATVLDEDGPLDEESSLCLGEDLNYAVEALWSQRKIHRDIKPQNIIRRDDDGRFVLLDPGIAFDPDDVSLTATGAIWHTKGYLAPELSRPDRKRDADCRSDFFLIGTVLYLASTGTHPFIDGPAQLAEEVLSNIVNRNPPPPHEVKADVSIELSKLIMRLLSKHRHARFRNSEMLRSALDNCRRSS